MADDVQEASSKTEPVYVPEKEDADTRAARRELKQSSISDQPAVTNDSTKTKAKAESDAPIDEEIDAKVDGDDDDLKEQVSSPKKKRAHDQVDDDVPAQDIDATSIASTDSGKDRATRLEPEKKRHRDHESKDGETEESTKTTTNTAADGDGVDKSEVKQTPSSAFAASGFGKLATSKSGFASLGASGGSAFGSAKPSLSSFASPTKAAAPQPAAAPAPKLTFGSASAKSPFAGLSGTSNGFGGGLSGTGFGAALSGAKPLSSFAAPSTKPFQSEKPAKPFGAPDSDAEDDEDQDDEEDEQAQAEETERAASPEKESDDKKKLKLHKVEVDDGEAGESTLVSVRAKMFLHDKEAGWKERGAGMLKINAPTSCVDFDDSGAVIPGSFDASGLEDTEDGGESGKSKGPKVVRLLMRQDQTHRVILNTAIVPATKFQEKASLKSVGILFTAFQGEDAKPVTVTMRMSAASAKAFLNEISFVQRELSGN